MKLVWIVGINISEINNVRAICATEEIAKRELFKVRDEMIRSFEYSIKSISMEEINLFYRTQKAILSNDDPQKWEDNSPYDYPYLSQERLREEEEEDENL